MSYDLDFLVQADRAPLAADALREYFGLRRWYEDQGSQFWYANEDTGVYFSFDVAAAEESELDDGLVPAGLSFNINYFRPHVFGLEAAQELEAVAARFSLLVDDPQIGGIGRGAFTSEGFLAGWNAGNRSGHRTLLASGHEGHAPSAHHSLPAAALERIWRWNYGRGGLQEVVGSAFVPRISFLEQGGRIQTFVVWGDAMSVALPDVDLLFLVRSRLAPRRWFRKKDDFCLVPVSEAATLLGQGRRYGLPSPYTLFDRVDPQAVDFFRSRTPLTEPLAGLPHDQVLTRELLEEAERSAVRDFVPHAPGPKPS